MSRTGPGALSLDTIFELLAHHRRRYALYALYRDEGRAISLDELASRVRDLEDPEERHDGRRADVTTSLRERHLPKLAEARVVEFDERSGAIRYRGQPSLEEWIEHAEFKEGKHPGG